MSNNPTRTWLRGGPPLVGVLLLVIVLVGGWALNFYPWFGRFLFVQFEGPRLQREFSFHAAWVTWPAAGAHGPFDNYTLTYVDPQGKLGLAGFKAGDIPCRYQHGAEPGFLRDLKAWENGETVAVQVVSGNEIWLDPPPVRTIKLSPALR